MKDDKRRFGCNYVFGWISLMVKLNYICNLVLLATAADISAQLSHWHHGTNRRALVGNYFSEVIPSKAFACHVTSVQVVERYSRDLPAWMNVDTANGHVYGVPQQNDVGIHELLVIGIGSNNHSQDVICRSFVRNVIVELHMNSLPLALDKWLPNIKALEHANHASRLLNCQFSSSVLIATMIISHRKFRRRSDLAKFAKDLERILELPIDVIQLLDDSSQFVYLKQLEGRKMLHSESQMEFANDTTFIIVSWPVSCGAVQLDSVKIHDIHRRNIPEKLNMSLTSLHLSVGDFDRSFRKRRAVFFGSVTALEGTPLETSVLPSLIVSTSLLNTSTSNFMTQDITASAGSFSSVRSSLESRQLTETGLSSSSTTIYRFKSTFSFQSQVATSYSLSLSTQSTAIVMTSSMRADSSYFQSSSSLKYTSLEGSLTMKSDMISSSVFNSTIFKSSLSSEHQRPNSTHSEILISSASSVFTSLPNLTASYSSLSSVTDGISSPTSQSYSHFKSFIFSTLSVVTSYTQSIISSYAKSSVFPSSMRPTSTKYPSLITTSSMISDYLRTMITTTSSISTWQHYISQSSSSSSFYISIITSLERGFTVTSQTNLSTSQISVKPSTSSSTKILSTQTSEVSTLATMTFPAPSFSTLPTMLYSSKRLSITEVGFSTTPLLPGTLSTPSISTISSSSSSSSHPTFFSTYTLLPRQSSRKASSSLSSFTDHIVANSSLSPHVTPSRSTSMSDRSQSASSGHSTPSPSEYLTTSTFLAVFSTSPLSKSRGSASLTDSLSLSSRMQSSIYTRSPIDTSSNINASQRTDFKKSTVKDTISSTFQVDSSIFTTSTKALTSLSIRVTKATSPALSLTTAPPTTNVPYYTAVTSTLVASSTRKVSSINSTTCCSKERSIFSMTSSLETTVKTIASRSSQTLQLSFISGSVAESRGTSASQSQYISTTQFSVSSKTSYYTSVMSMLSGSLPTSSYSTGTSKLLPSMTTLETTSAVNSSIYDTSLLHSKPLSISKVLSTTSTVLDSAPILVNGIGILTSYVGRLFTFKIPYDTFYDKEDGWTNKLRVKCEFLTGQPLPGSFWVRFNNTSQTISGLALAEDYNLQNQGRVSLQIIAIDRSGNTAKDIIVIKIKNSNASMLFTLTATIQRDYGEFLKHRNLRVRLLERIIQFYNTSSVPFYVVTISNGSVIFTWSDTSLASTSCDKNAVALVTNKVILTSGSPTPEFTQALLPDFPIIAVKFAYRGVCLSPVPVTPSATTPTLVYKHQNVFLSYVLPLLAVGFIAAVIIGTIVFVSKRRRKKPSFLEKYTFKKRQPILLPEEHELELFPAMAVTLPEDYMYNGISDKYKLNKLDQYEETPVDDENGLIDDLDDIYFGLNSFPNSPPPYHADRINDDFERVYESPYSHPPPTYKLPPIYCSIDEQSSEV